MFNFSSGTSAQVSVLTLLSKTHIDRGRFAVSFDVTERKNVDAVKRNRKEEEQVYIEHESVVGSCSPEFQIALKNKKCDIQFSISGALKPQSLLEEGEDIIEYNSSLSECRRLLTLVPTYDQETQGNATIKFKVEGKVKHTVTIHDVPIQRGMSTTSSESSFLDIKGPERQESVFSNSVSSQSFESSEMSSVNISADGEDSVDAGSTIEQIDTASGEGQQSAGNYAKPFTDRSLNEEMENMAIRNRGQEGQNPGGPPVQPPYGAHNGQRFNPNVPPTFPQGQPQIGQQGYPNVPPFSPNVLPQQGPKYVPPDASQPNNETAYDRILCNESLNALSGALSPSDASRLLVGLGVSNSTIDINKKNHQGDVVSAIYQTFLHWRAQKRSRKQEHEASNQHLYEDLLLELQDIGRKDIKVVIKQALENNKKLEKNDFSRL